MSSEIRRRSNIRKKHVRRESPFADGVDPEIRALEALGVQDATPGEGLSRPGGLDHQLSRRLFNLIEGGN